MKNNVVRVPVIESERDWGSKVDDYMVCLNSDDASSFIQEFNADNNLKNTPDWYMYADVNILPITIDDAQYEKLRFSKRMWLSELNRK